MINSWFHSHYSKNIGFTWDARKDASFEQLTKKGGLQTCQTEGHNKKEERSNKTLNRCLTMENTARPQTPGCHSPKKEPDDCPDPWLGVALPKGYLSKLLIQPNNEDLLG